MSFLPADSDAVLSIFRAGIVHLDHDEDVLELALDIGNERSGSRLLKSGNQIRPKIYLPIGWPLVRPVLQSSIISCDQ